MSARFAALFGYRLDDDGVLTTNPNTSDAHDSQSVALGTALLDRLGVARTTPAPANIDKRMTDAVDAALVTDLPGHLEFSRDRPLYEFEQFHHLGVFATIKHDPLASPMKKLKALAAITEPKRPQQAKRAAALLAQVNDELAEAANERRVIAAQLGDEKFLNVDLVGSRSSLFPPHHDHLHLGLSLKWTLRTDRAQDCVAQGSYMAARRQGRMPHFAVVTIEARPAMLRLLAGSTAVDTVYHLALPELIETIDAYAALGGRAQAKVAESLHRMVESGRVRDYDDLVTYVRSL